MHRPIDGISATDTAPVSETGKFCETFYNEMSFSECVRHCSLFYGILSAVASDWSAFLTRAQGKCMYKVYLKNFSWQPLVCAYFK